jgi:5'(3')-deoxyribonucleotidase
MISHIFVDMDGVLSNWTKGFLTRLQNKTGRVSKVEDWIPGEWEISKNLGMTEEEVWDIAENPNPYDFWFRLPPFPWYSQLLVEIKNFADYSICSTPSDNPQSPAAKLAWLQYWISPKFGNWFFCKEKFRLAQPTTVLIDDSDKNIEKFREAGGHAIIFPQRWNSGHNYDGDKVEYVVKELQFINDILSHSSGYVKNEV